MRFPRHRAAASLKRPAGRPARSRRITFSAASGRGLIEAASVRARSHTAQSSFSAASGRGLIEAQGREGRTRALHRFPRHRAAASLKPLAQPFQFGRYARFPRHRAAASLKPDRPGRPADRPDRFPRHRAAASLKLRFLLTAGPVLDRFPRHRAAASLKPRGRGRGRRGREGRFPRHRAAASLKRHIGRSRVAARLRDVFRGIGPRPH